MAVPETELWVAGAVTVTARPWSHNKNWAHLLISGAHSGHAALPDGDMVGRWLQQLSDLGYEGVRTGAVGPDLARILSDNGFQPVQHLTLLSADLSGRLAPHTPTTSVRPLRVPCGRRATDRVRKIVFRTHRVDVGSRLS